MGRLLVLLFASCLGVPVPSPSTRPPDPGDTDVEAPADTDAAHTDTDAAHTDTDAAHTDTEPARHTDTDAAHTDTDAAHTDTDAAHTDVDPHTDPSTPTEPPEEGDCLEPAGSTPVALEELARVFDPYADLPAPSFSEGVTVIDDAATLAALEADLQVALPPVDLSTERVVFFQWFVPSSCGIGLSYEAWRRPDGALELHAQVIDSTLHCCLVCDMSWADSIAWKVPASALETCVEVIGPPCDEGDSDACY